MLDLDRLEALANAATDGPWEVSGHDSGHSEYEMNWYVIQPEAGDFICDMEALQRISVNERHAKDEGEADAEFIAAAREALPELIAEVRRLAGESARWEGMANAVASDFDHKAEEVAYEHRLRVEAEGAWGRWQRRAEKAEAERDALASKVAAVQERHRSNGFGDCRDCDYSYPCPTIRALDAQTDTPGSHSAPSGQLKRFTDEDSASGGER